MYYELSNFPIWKFPNQWGTNSWHSPHFHGLPNCLQTSRSVVNSSGSELGHPFSISPRLLLWPTLPSQLTATRTWFLANLHFCLAPVLSVLCIEYHSRGTFSPHIHLTLLHSAYRLVVFPSKAYALLLASSPLFPFFYPPNAK